MPPTSLRRSVPLSFLAVTCPTICEGAQEEKHTTIVSAARSEDTATSSPLLDVSVTGAELMRTNERSLPRALAKAAGVWVQETNLGGGAPVIGGMLGNRIVIVVDGVRLNDSTTRLGPNQYLNSIPPEIVERIDVLRGPGSVLYGSDAIGGAILIWTRRRDPARGDAARAGLHGELGGEYVSSADGWRGNVGGSWAGDTDGLLGSLGYEDWGDLRSGNGEEWPTAYDGRDLFGSWVHDLVPGRSLRLTALASRQEDVPRTDRLVTGYGQTQPSNDRWDYSLQDHRRYVANYTDEQPGGLTDRMDVRVSMRTYTEERSIQGNGSSELSSQRDEIFTLGVGVDWKKALGEAHLLTWGLDADHDEVDSSTVAKDLTSGVGTPEDGAFAPDARYTSGGIFLQDELLKLDPVDVTAGVRWSWASFGFDEFASAGTGHESGDFQALTASLAAATDLAQGVRLTGVLAQGFRAPNLEDLANESDFYGGTELPNPDLDPEQSTTAELVLDTVRPAWNASIGAWYSYIDDLIGRRLIDAGDPTTTGDETYLRDNAGYAHLFGADFSGRHRLGSDGSPWAVEGNLSYAWGQQYDDTQDPTGAEPLYDVPFRRIPPLFGRAALVWDRLGSGRPVERGAFSAFFATEQDRLNPDDKSDPRIDPTGTDGWIRLDLDFEGPLNRQEAPAQARWTFGIHNLLDASYRVHASGLDAPGLGVVVGVRVTV
jgi:outer membrane receptor protein involved in Fe transport